MTLKEDYNATNVNITGGYVDAPVGTRSAQPVIASPLISKDAAYLSSCTVIDGVLVIAYAQGTLPSEMASTDTTYDFQREMTEGDFILLRWGGQFEYITVGAVDSGTEYAITRDSTSETWGALDWPINQPYIILGQEGAGRLELSAEGGAPRLRIIEQGATADAETTLGVLGELNGHYGISTSTIGLGLGVSNGTAAPTGAVLTVDPTNGMKISTSGNEMQMDSDGITLEHGDLGIGMSNPQKIKWATSTPATISSILSGFDGTNDILQINISSGVGSGSATEIALGADTIKCYGDLGYTGDLTPARGSTTYTGYITVPLPTPATSTSWDGDAKDTADNGIIDLSSVFGLPAGIKGVFAKLSAKNTSVAGKYSSLGADSSNPYALVVTPRDTLDIGLNNGPAFVPCDSNGDIYFKTDAANGAENIVSIQIYGYLI